MQLDLNLLNFTPTASLKISTRTVSEEELVYIYVGDGNIRYKELKSTIDEALIQEGFELKHNDCRCRDFSPQSTFVCGSSVEAVKEFITSRFT